MSFILEYVQKNKHNIVMPSVHSPVGILWKEFMYQIQMLQETWDRKWKNYEFLWNVQSSNV